MMDWETTLPLVSICEETCLPSGVVVRKLLLLAVYDVVNVLLLIVRVSVWVVSDIKSAGLLRTTVLVIVPERVFPPGVATEKLLGIEAIIPQRGSGPSVIVETVPSPEVTVVVPLGRITLVVEQGCPVGVFGFSQLTFFLRFIRIFQIQRIPNTLRYTHRAD